MKRSLMIFLLAGIAFTTLTSTETFSAKKGIDVSTIVACGCCGGNDD